MLTLLAQNEDVFATEGEPTPYAEHAINTGDHPPISLPPYRMSPARKEQLKSELDRLLKDSIIEETKSPWAAPVVLVPKKGGGIRLCRLPETECYYCAGLLFVTAHG